MSQTKQVCPYCDMVMSNLMKECISCGTSREEMVEYESYEPENESS